MLIDNDGIEAFIEHHLPYLGGLGTAIVVSIAGRTSLAHTCRPLPMPGTLLIASGSSVVWSEWIVVPT